MTAPATTDRSSAASRFARLGLAVARLAFAMAIVASAALLSAGFGTRLGLWRFTTGFKIMEWSAFGGIATMLVSIAALVILRKKSSRSGRVPAIVALLAGLIVFAVPLYMLHSARNVPPIHDITTDTDNPPAFVAALPLRAKAVNGAAYEGSEVARQQQQAYPDIKPVQFNQPPAQVFDAALASAKSLGWKIIAAVPIEGRIEANDTTFWFGFTDDIVIRIAASGTGARLDIRSESRVGHGDVGTNARRIRKFLGTLADRVAAK